MQHKIYAQGDKVRIKSAESKIDERIVWGQKDGIVLICSARQYEWLKTGDLRAAPIGVRAKDILEVYA